MRSFLRTTAYALHICAEKRVNTRDAQHYGGRLFAAVFAYLFDGAWYFGKVPPRYDVGFVKQHVKHSAAVSAGRAGRRCVAPAAARGYKQHY